MAEIKSTKRSRPQRDVPDRRRTLLAWLYFPYTWLVYIPLFAILSSILGTIGMAIATFNNKLSEKAGVVWGICCCLTNFTWVTVRGREHLTPGRSYVILANHASHFDIFTVYGFMNIPFRWVMKQELRKTPFIGWYTAAAGHIFVDRSNHERALASLEEAKRRLEDGLSVLFFPEGTRSIDGRLKRFKKGGFHMALDLGFPILPVAISGAHKVLPSKTLRLLPGPITMTILPPIETTGYTRDNLDELMSRTRKALQQGLDEWQRGDD
jgi:1-acyl-sn-glycerol-3-phosphate acyltransferase